MVHQKKSQLWGVPKGRKDVKEESFDDCMKREVKEEVGLEMDFVPHEVLDIMSIYSKTKIYLIKLMDEKMVHCEPPLEDGKENHEIDVVEWVLVTEAVTRKTNSITRRALNRFLARRPIVQRDHPPYELQMQNYDVILEIAAEPGLPDRRDDNLPDRRDDNLPDMRSVVKR
jgi:8-oxo-dGTP pyrophosphatase MutT (NUDIX family)